MRKRGLREKSKWVVWRTLCRRGDV